jgi:hypothetical protein
MVVHRPAIADGLSINDALVNASSPVNVVGASQRDCDFAKRIPLMCFCG